MRPLILPLLAVSLGLPFSCTTTEGARAKQTFDKARVTTETAIAKTLISDEDEAQLGQQLQGELAKQGVKELNDPTVVSYVQGLVGKIAPLAQRDRQTQFTVHVIDDPKTVNAFAAPGGHVYVYTGLLLSADDEAEVLGVLSHELGHVVARHTARQLVGQYGLNVVNQLVLGKDPGTLAKVAAAIAGNGAMLAHSRASENEADAYAVRYTSALGYDPTGISRFFQKLMASQGRMPRVLTWLSTHPANEDRIAHVNRLIAEEGLTGTEVGAERLAPIKTRLGTTQPAPSVSTR